MVETVATAPVTRTPNPVPAIDWRKPPVTREEQLARIQILADRIAKQVHFIAEVGTLAGTSDEAKQRAVTRCHACLTEMERSLARIHDELNLG